MRNALDFSSWEGALTTLLGLALVSLVAVGIRMFFMHTVQARRERANRQINERLKTLITAYKTLGGSFTGDLTVDPTHLRELRKTQVEAKEGGQVSLGSDRRRRLRDSVEAALSDVMLLGTAEQVRLASRAASDLVAGRNVETAALVISLRDFIREVLDLDPVPKDVVMPKQGPLRPGTSGARGGKGDVAGGGNKGGERGQGAGDGGLGGGLSADGHREGSGHHASSDTPSSDA